VISAAQRSILIRQSFERAAHGSPLLPWVCTHGYSYLTPPGYFLTFAIFSVILAAQQGNMQRMVHNKKKLPAVLRQGT